MNKSQTIQLTSAADNALHLLNQMLALEPFELPSCARELARDAAAPLRNALRRATLQEETPANAQPSAETRSADAVLRDLVFRVEGMAIWSEFSQMRALCNEGRRTLQLPEIKR